MKNFYKLRPDEGPEFGVAYSDDDVDSCILWEGVTVTEWEPVIFTLKNGGFADYQINDCGWSLCSEKLKTIIDRQAAPLDSRQWLAADVVDANNHHEPYFILHIPNRPDVLNEVRTLYADDDFVVKPVLSRKKIGRHKVFSYRSAVSMVIVSEEVKEALVAAQCEGIEFGPIGVSE